MGIGLDAGEAVPVEGGYRGGALNLELVRVVPEGVDPAERLQAALPALEAPPRRPVERILVAAAVAIALAVTAGVVLIRDEPTTIAAGAWNCSIHPVVSRAPSRSASSLEASRRGWARCGSPTRSQARSCASIPRRSGWTSASRWVDLAPIIPFGNGVTIQLVSERVGNVQANPQLGVLLQMWNR
ncbi:MAG: hypothetical protein ACXWX4_10230 [Actinomycetota bacterium]